LYCDRKKCDLLHNDQLEYFHSPQYAADHRPWQHEDAMITNLGQLPRTHPNRKLDKKQ
jgi:hypothetical protein